MTQERKLLQRGALGALSLAIIVSTFVYFLPTIANYADVWKVVKELSWQWAVALLVATVLNLVTFAPPWMVTLPGLSFFRAMEVTQASTALSIVVPGGVAVGAAGAYGMLRRRGFAPQRHRARSDADGSLESVPQPLRSRSSRCSC